MNTHYTIQEFIRDAKSILAREEPLEKKKEAIGEQLKILSKRDDLTRFGQSLGPTDASTNSYLLWRERPYTVLTLAQFDPNYLSPVHDHGDFWVVVAGYRGIDRWDMYERQDDGTRPGYADLKMVDQLFLPPGKSLWMPEPPRTIHSHNNITPGLNMEVVFTAATPQTPEQRLVFDVDGKRCWPSPWDMSKRKGEDYPPVPAARSLSQPEPQAVGSGLLSLLRPNRFNGRFFGGCPVCMALA